MKAPDFTRTFSFSSAPVWFFLMGLQTLYRVVNSIWRFLWLSGIKKGHRSSKPVISVGNITVGGTGKSPMTDYLLSLFSQKNTNISVLTRGYKSENEGKTMILPDAWKESPDWRKYGDEPVMLSKRHPETKIYISPDRVGSSIQAEATSDLFILDDGMQHLKLERDLNLVLIDASQGIGNGWLLPLGPLREPITELKRADAVIFTKTNLQQAEDLEKDLIRYFRKGVPGFHSTYQVDALISLSGEMQPTERLKGQKCLLFSGIGNPAGFEASIQKMGGIIHKHLIYTDHESYEDEEKLDQIRLISKNHSGYIVLTTEKDAVKLKDLSGELPEIWYPSMKMEMPKSFETFIFDWYEKQTLSESL